MIYKTCVLMIYRNKLRMIYTPLGVIKNAKVQNPFGNVTLTSICGNSP